MKLIRRPSSSEGLFFLIIAVQVLVLGAPDPALPASDFNYAAVLESTEAQTDCSGPPSPVAISGDTVVGGLSYCDAGGVTNAGAAVVFEKPGGGWSGTVNQIQFLTPTDQGTNDYFGDGVAIDGNTLVAGSLHTGEPNANRAVYVFSRSAPADPWVQVAKLSATDNLNSFGSIFAISGSTIVVGDFTPGDGTRPGAAYIYVEPGSGWTDTTQTAKLVPTNGFGNMRFGTSVAIDGDTIAVGAGFDNSNLGGGYVFVRPPGGWGTAGGGESKLIPSGADANAYLGRTRNLIDVDAGTVVLGGLNNQIFIFEKPGTGWADSTQPAAILSPNIARPYGVAVQDNAVHLNVFYSTGTSGWMTFEKPVSGGWADTSTSSDQTTTPNATGISVDGDTGVTGHYVYVAGVASPPVLSVSIGDAPDPVVVNGDLTYTVTVENNGPGVASSVIATDTLPDGVIYNGSLPSGGCTEVVPAGTVRCDLGDLGDGAFASVQVNVTVPASAGTITNSISVDAKEIQAPVIATEDTQVVDAVADLEILLFSHDPEPASAGSTLRYSVDVINNGPNDAQAVTVTVGLPPGTALIEATALDALGQTINGACSEVSESVVCEIGTVIAWDTVQVFVDLQLPSTVGIISNTAEVVSNVADSQPDNNVATEEATVIVAGVDVTDSVNDPDDYLLDFGLVDVGASVAGTVTVTNNRSGPVAVTVNFTLAQPFSIATNTCAGSDLPAGVSCEVAVLFEPSQPDGGATSSAFQLDVGGVSVPFTVSGEAVVSQAELKITYFGRPASSPANQTQYDIHILNDGPADAEGFYLNLDLPVQATQPGLFAGDPIGDLLVAGGCTDTLINVDTGQHRFHCELPSGEVFPAYGTADLSVGVVRSGTLDQATLTIGATTPDPDESNNTATTDAPSSGGGGGGVFPCISGETVDDISSTKPGYPNGILFLGLTALLLLGWSRARRRTTKVRP